MSPELETFRRAFDFALARLICDLKDAQDYLGAGEDNAAIGTLVAIEDLFADMQAAKRLFIGAKRRVPHHQPPTKEKTP